MRETYDLKNDAFISQLEARVRRKIETNVGNFNPPFNYEDEVSPATREVLNASFSIIENFFYQLYEDRMPSEKIEEKIQRYTENNSFYSDNMLKKLPIIPEGLRPKYKVLKSITPSNTELDKNSRARSAKLRIIEKVK